VTREPPDPDLDPGPGPDPGPDPLRYFALFNEVAIVEQLSRALLEARLPPPLIAPHFAVLNHLVRVRDGRTPLELAGAFQVPKTTMTHTLAGLAQAGLVEARPHPEDGRSKQVFLTEAGRRVRKDAIAALAPEMTSIAEGFPPERVEAVLPALADLRRLLDARRS
jgi:DNA-binding MarR family transcriptional regulator